MSANIIPDTEDFSSSVWSPNDAGMVVTVNTTAAPAFAGQNAGMADKLEDTTAALVATLLNLPSFDIIVDSTSWILSLFVKKDAITSRFPEFVLFLSGGTSIFTGISLNTSNGNIANSANAGVAPDDKAVVDVDANWWRVWFKIANNGTNNLIRAQLSPAQSETLGGSNNGTLTGDITAWGINLTNDNTLQDYQPNPFYPFTASFPFIAMIGAKKI